MAFSNGTVVNGCTVTAQPTGTGIYGGQFLLTRPDSTTFYDYLNAYSGAEPQNQTTIFQNGFNVNASNPFPVNVTNYASFPGGSGGSSPATSVHYDVVTGGTGYSTGDVLAEVSVLTIGSPSTITVYWENITAGTVLATPPTLANLTYRQKLNQITLADTLAAVVSTAVAGFNMGWNGTNWDRLKSDNTGHSRVSMYGKLSSVADTALAASAAGQTLVNTDGATSAVTSVAASTTVATALSANTARKKAIIYNSTGSLMRVKLGTAASTSSYSYTLSPESASIPGGTLETQYSGAITVILVSGTGNAFVTELT